MLLNKQCFTTIVLKATALSTILLRFKIQNLKFKNSKIQKFKDSYLGKPRTIG